MVPASVTRPITSGDPAAGTGDTLATAEGDAGAVGGGDEVAAAERGVVGVGELGGAELHPISHAPTINPTAATRIGRASNVPLGACCFSKHRMYIPSRGLGQEKDSGPRAARLNDVCWAPIGSKYGNPLSNR